MITSLDIKNFKSLASCRIDNLKRVNLFLGKNNVGKSSLLEAISLYLSQASPVWIQTLMRDRGLTLFFQMLMLLKGLNLRSIIFPACIPGGMSRLLNRRL